MGCLFPQLRFFPILQYLARLELLRGSKELDFA